MAQQDDNAMDGLLRRSLARNADATAECPDAEILAAYYEHSLDANEAAAFELHFAQCARCREQLAAMVRAESEVKVPAAQVVAAAAVSTLHEKAAAPAAVSVSEKPTRSWAFDWRWLVPAAAVVIFAAIVYVRIAPREARSLLSKEVAISKPETSPQPAPSQNPAVPAATSLTAPESRVNPSAGTRGKLTPALPPPSKELAPQAHPSAAQGAPAAPAPNSPARIPAIATSHTSQYVGEAVPRSGAAGARTSSGGQAANIPSAARLAGQKQAAAAPAATKPAQDREAEQRTVAGIPAEAVSSVEAVLSAPPADAKKDSEAANSKAQTAQSSAASDQGKAPEAAGGSAGGAINAMTQTVSANGSTAALTVSAEVAPLYRVTPEGSVERSTDGGATWQPEHLKTKAPIVAASAPSGKVCWLVGRDGTILLTKNGKSWKKITPPIAIDLTEVTAQDERSATVTAIDGRKFSTTDGGKTWQQVK
jgi:hypothetical protein